jgi:hypothetical protein
VCQGGTLKTIRECLDLRFEVYGFDSFEGLPEDWPGTGCVKGEFSTQGLVPDISGTVIFSGWFKDTLPNYLKQARKIALLHLDCDLYSSTREVLWALNEFIVPGTIIVCDEYIYKLQAGGYGNEHEQRAIIEWCETFNRQIVHVPFEDITPNHGNERRIFRAVE